MTSSASTAPGDTPGAFRLVAAALATQVRVIHALMLHETKTRYGEHKMGFLWAFVEPMIVVGVLAFIFSSFRADNPGGMPLVPYMVTGFVPFMMFRDLMGTMIPAITQSRALLAFPQVTTFDAIAARALLEVSILLVVFAVLLSLLAVGGIEYRIEDPLRVLAACGLLAMSGTGMGFILASLSPMMPAVRQIVTGILGRPLFFASGLFFTAESLPPAIREWLLWNPLLHMLELLRSGFFHEFESTHGSWRYALGWAAGLLAVGLLTHQALRKRAVVVH